MRPATATHPRRPRYADATSGSPLASSWRGVAGGWTLVANWNGKARRLPKDRPRPQPVARHYAHHMSAPTDTNTPADLARELGHTDDGRAIRRWLRLNETRPEIEKRTRWALTDEQVQRVRVEFAER